MVVAYLRFFFFAPEKDRDGVIATVEDARAAEEREANRLRKILEGAGKLSPLPSGANGTVAAANGTSVGDADNAGGGYRDELAVGAEVCQGCTTKRQDDTTLLLVKRSK